MTFSKWLPTGELDNAAGDTLTASNLNDMIDEVVVPIGAVIDWHKSLTGVPATLPTGWVECNGQVLSDADSPLNGQTIPNLNNSGGSSQNYFTRGGTTSGSTGGAITGDFNIGSSQTNFTSGITVLTSFTANDVQPPWFQMVKIMRVK